MSSEEQTQPPLSDKEQAAVDGTVMAGVAFFRNGLMLNAQTEGLLDAFVKQRHVLSLPCQVQALTDLIAVLGQREALIGFVPLLVLAYRLGLATQAVPVPTSLSVLPKNTTFHHGRRQERAGRSLCTLAAG